MRQHDKSRKLKVSGAPRPRGFKLLLFRLLACVIIPLVFLLVCELTLRAIGVGYPTSFMLKKEFSGRELLVQNDQFGWRFFGAKRARVGTPFAISPKAEPNTIRIFVMGESAAFGDPHPDFGLSRMLEAMLGQRYPSSRFEVVNVAITAINSHVIREIAKDCSSADGDIWVLYIGNNEVVGPFGGGTVFGPQVPPLAAIRANLMIKSTRTGQLIDAIGSSIKQKKKSEETWGGMMMFLDQKVCADDPRMQRVYDHFQTNIEEIIGCGRKAGANIALCTVGVNLKDSAPFASQCDPNTSSNATALWKQHYEQGIVLQEKGQWADAMKAYNEAEAIDAQFADLHFRKGQCALEMDDASMALSEFSKARDLDALRFRFDSRMSQIIKTIATQRNDPQVRFVDAEASLAAASPHGIPGREFFYDHVHLTWEGNWVLALSIAEQIDSFLPATVKNDSKALADWPSSAQCAQRLAWTDFERFKYLNDMRGRLEIPPFTNQFNHKEHVAYLMDTAQSIENAAGPAGLNQTLQRCESAVASAPNDAVLQGRLATLRLTSGNPGGAVEAARKATVLLPHEAAVWDRLAIALAESKQVEEAILKFEHAVSLDERNVRIRHHLAQAYVYAGRLDEALEQLERIIKQQPEFGAAYVNMGEILESKGQIKEAERLYRKAIKNPAKYASDLAILGKLCLSKGWYQEAFKNLQNAALQAPTDASIRYDLAATLKALGREVESSEQLVIAQQYDPGAWTEIFMKGIEYASNGEMEKSIGEFREVIRLQPNMLEAHFNLAIALADLNRMEEAADEFKHVLRLDPKNERAINFLRNREKQ